MQDIQSIAYTASPKVTVIIVNWNSLNYLRACLKSIYHYTPVEQFEVVVFDNASEESVEPIQREFPSVKVLLGKRNYGFAKANNIAAANANGELLLFLNPDTVFTASTIEGMVSVCERRETGIVGVKLLNGDLSVQTSCIQNYPTILNQLFDIEVIRLRWPACPLWNLEPLFRSGIVTSRVEAVSGACFMVRREVFMELNGFSDDYFMYAEDLDLSYRCQAAGYSNLFLNAATVIHFGGKSSGQRGANHWATTMRFESVSLFLRKTRGSLYAWVFRLAMGLAAAARLTFVLIAWPLNNRLFDGAYALSKWRTVLKWAFRVSPNSV